MGGEDFGKIHAPKDVGRLIEAINRALKSQFLVGARHLRLGSLEDLKEQVEKVARFQGDVAPLLEALLWVAEKNGLALGGPRGVYYWVWFLAHERDPSVGGEDFGKRDAPKMWRGFFLRLRKFNGRWQILPSREGSWDRSRGYWRKTAYRPLSPCSALLTA